MVNNGYSNSFVDKNIKHFIDGIAGPEPSTTPPSGQIRKLFYRNQFNNQYKQDERALRKIIRDNVKTVKPEDRLNIIIYYQNQKTKNLVMKNNLATVRTLAKTNLIYQFTCPKNECLRSDGKSNYVGYTTCSLSRRLSLHLQNGSIKEHFRVAHNCKISRVEIVENTIIRYIERDTHRLRLLEALVIAREAPRLNAQDTGLSRTLLLYS